MLYVVRAHLGEVHPGDYSRYLSQLLWKAFTEPVFCYLVVGGGVLSENDSILVWPEGFCLGYFNTCICPPTGGFRSPVDARGKPIAMLGASGEKIPPAVRKCERVRSFAAYL